MDVSPHWFASLSLLRLVILGSAGALAVSVLVLLLIWWQEWRSGRIW